MAELKTSETQSVNAPQKISRRGFLHRAGQKALEAAGLYVASRNSVIPAAKTIAGAIGETSKATGTTVKSGADTVASGINTGIDKAAKTFLASTKWDKEYQEKYKTGVLGPNEQFVSNLRVKKSYFTEDITSVNVRDVPQLGPEFNDISTSVGTVPLDTPISEGIQFTDHGDLWIAFPERLLQGTLVDEKGKVVETDPDKMVTIKAAYMEKVAPKSSSPASK